MFIRQALAVDLSTWYPPATKLNTPTLGGIAGPIINNVIVLSGVFAFIVIIFAGYNYITGAGDKAKVAQAQNMLTYAIIGLVLIAAAYLITNIIFKIIGYQFF